MADIDHVDATTFGIAVGLVDEDGKDPQWVRMVVAAKGFGDINIDAAREWLRQNPKGCRCAKCSRVVVKASREVPMQLDMFG